MVERAARACPGSETHAALAAAQSLFSMRSLSIVLVSLSLVPCAVRAAEASPAPTNLDALVASVVARHPELAFYEAELAAARAEGRAARAWSDPELSVSFGRKSVSEAGLSREGAAWSVSLAQTFEWPGRITLRKAVADRDLALAELALANFRAELGGRVRALACGLLAARDKTRAIEEVAARFTELKNTFLAREPGGLTPQLEIRVIEAQELVLQRRATQARLEIDAALIALNLLRGAAPQSPLELAGRGLTLVDAPADASLLATALEHNLDFRARVLEIERQGLRVDLARHEGRPAVTLAPFFEEENAVGRERTVGLGVSVPLPVGGRASAATAGAEARRAQAEASLAASRLDLEREVVTALHAYRTHGDDRRRWPASTIESFREAAAAADRHYRLGAVPIGVYVELQASYLDAVESVVEIEQAVLEAGLRLESLTSGAWRAVEVTP
jgi:cobalt-zinc-cadmium efflux system outer membrane protein